MCQAQIRFKGPKITKNLECYVWTYIVVGISETNLITRGICYPSFINSNEDGGDFRIWGFFSSANINCLWKLLSIIFAKHLLSLIIPLIGWNSRLQQQHIMFTPGIFISTNWNIFISTLSVAMTDRNLFTSIHLFTTPKLIYRHTSPLQTDTYLQAYI